MCFHFAASITTPHFAIMAAAVAFNYIFIYRFAFQFCWFSVSFTFCVLFCFLWLPFTFGFRIFLFFCCSFSSCFRAFVSDRISFSFPFCFKHTSEGMHSLVQFGVQHQNRAMAANSYT